MIRATVRQLLASIFRIVLRRSDVDRWRDLGNHDLEWDQRSRLIAGLIPKGAIVLEFGAGRRALESLLDSSCRYLPADLVSRGPDTLVFDLNARPLPDLTAINADVAVFGGVLEYVARLADVPPWLARSFETCIVSYECARTSHGAAGHLRERADRAQIGWLSTFSEPDLLQVFEEAGFTCAQKVVWHTIDGDEPIFVFRRR